MAVVIKGVSDETWKQFKSCAAKEGMKLGDFFTKLVEMKIPDEKPINKDEYINSLFSNDPALSDKEANKIMKIIKDMEKEYK